MNKVVAFILVLFFSVTVGAQEEPIPEQQQLADYQLSGNGAMLESLEFDRVFDEVSGDVAASDGLIKQSRVENEFYYVIILALLCLTSLSLVLTFLVRLKQDVTPKDIVSGAGLTLIVFGTIILVLIVDTSEQLTAAIGILGAIAGYLFRSAQESTKTEVIEREA